MRPSLPYKSASSPHRSVSGGFSLVELLVSLGIITTLTSISLTVINPVELMRQARDTKRIEEFGSLHSALLLTWGEFPETPLGTVQTVYLSLPDASSTCGSYAGLLPSLPNGWSYKCVPSTALRNVNGTGWIPVDFTTVSASLNTAPLTTLPIDPLNTHLSYYRFVVSSENKYELDTPLESVKIDLDQKDGGSDDTLYEVGSSLSIYPIAGYLASDVTTDTGQTIFAAGSQNQVAYFLTPTSIIGNNALYWNPTSGYLGINTSANPQSALDIVGNVNWSGTLQSGSVPWARLSAFPSACTSGQYVSAIGSTLTCSAPAGGVGGSGTANYLTKWSTATTTTDSVIYDNGTNVGIGTTTPGQKLAVSGNVQATQFIGDGSQLTGIAGVPTNTVVFYNGTSCPSGWSELTAARGRTVVGLPLSGTATGTVGTALTNLGTRTITDVPAHTHPVDPSATNTSSAGDHTHSGTESSHTHTIPSGNCGQPYGVNAFWYCSNADASNPYNTSGGSGSITINSGGSHTHSVDIASFSSGSTGSASVDVTMPYIQLLVCQKN